MFVHSVCSHWHLSMRNIKVEDCVSFFHDLLNGFFFYLFVVAQNKKDREKKIYLVSMCHPILT